MAAVAMNHNMSSLPRIGPGPLGTSDQEDARRQQFRQEMQNDMQRFLAAQARENPRLRNLRNKQSEVTESPSKANSFFNGGYADAGQRGQRNDPPQRGRESPPPRNQLGGGRDEYGGRGQQPDSSRRYAGASDYPEERRRQRSYGHDEGPSHHPDFGRMSQRSERPSYAYSSPYQSSYDYRSPMPPPSDPYGAPHYWRQMPDRMPRSERPYWADGPYASGGMHSQSWSHPPPPPRPYEASHGYDEPPPRRMDARAGPQYPPEPRYDTHYDEPPHNQPPRSTADSRDPDRRTSEKSDKARAYAADLERQIEEKRRASERERSHRQAPSYTGSNPITGAAGPEPNTNYAKTSIRMSQGYGVTGGGSSSLSGAVQRGSEQGIPPPPSSKSEYLRELDMQVQLKRQQAEEEKRQLRLSDEKTDREAASYNPWGDPGHSAAVMQARNAGYGGAAGQASQAPPPGAFVQGGRFGATPTPAGGGAAYPGHNPTPSPGPMLLASQQTPLPPIGDQAPNYTRGQRRDMPDWEKEELMKKHRVQNEHQESLRRQMAEREAQKAEQIALAKAEEAREQDRIRRENEEIKRKYAREEEEAKRKDEEARKENERKAAERVAEQERRERAYKEAQEEARKAKAAMRQSKNGGGGAQEQPGNYPTTNRSSSPSLPTHQTQRAPEANAPPPVFRSSSPPIPTLRGQAAPPSGHTGAHQPFSEPAALRPPPQAERYMDRGHMDASRPGHTMAPPASLPPDQHNAGRRAASGRAERAQGNGGYSGQVNV
ncbi:uncharacterized protein EV422DRAFT_305626 [Fimicolochytrium jonesii]|uniref:uncharacterized protein n=1 Tax=Fimicolochytrium jonesii TaxID=1396493 RepID=UPI0022FEFF72|nr:uncharacterized protein EV422DRAFT_305626 [Fimicolochytrium jonesii]KAI8824070.1 hypothetical protein EV422DRAFT_305626 [Fimicolochytrium jonesii]